jgi:hypothetical protein
MNNHLFIMYGTLRLVTLALDKSIQGKVKVEGQEIKRLGEN